MTEVLAFGFASPTIAAIGAAAATGPIIIHILNRRRFRLLDWAPMRFLLLSQKRNRRRLKLEELILLALRCLAILLIGLAIARPRSTAALLPTAADQPTDTVYILDDSASTAAARAGRSVFAAAREDLAERLGALRPADSAAVYLTRDAGERAYRPLSLVEDAESVANDVMQIAPTQTRGGLAETLAAARAALADSTNTCRVVVLTDCRLVDYQDAAKRALAEAAADLAEAEIELLWVDHGLRIEDNLTLSEFRLLDKDVIVNTSARLSVTVRNHGSAPAANVSLRVSAGAIELNESIDAIPAGQSQTLEVPIALPEVGATVVTAELGADGLVADNRRSIVLDVRRARPILIVDGQMDTVSQTPGESLFLAVAMDPDGDASLGNAVEIISAENVANARFEQYDLVILTDVPMMPSIATEDGSLTSPQVDALRRYVEGGGGLAIFTGPDVNLDFYNGPMYEAGLIPYRLRAPVGDARRRIEGYRFRPGSAADIPMLRAFAGDEANFAGLFRFYRFHLAEEQFTVEADDVVGPPQVLIRLDDEASSPAIAERAIGEGLVMMMYSTASTAWNDWPGSFNLTFPAVVTDMVSRLSRPHGGQFTDLVGQGLFHEEYRLAPDLVRLRTPAYPAEDIAELPIETEGQRWSVATDRTNWAGVYELSFDPPDRSPVLLARNVDPAEGDLAKADETLLAATLGDENFVYLDRTVAEAQSQPAGRISEYWRILLIAALAALAVEVLLAQRFGHHSVVGSARPGEKSGGRA